MFTPLMFGSALLMIVISAACWGSWANTFKGVKNYRFELFYWDYAIGIFLATLVYALTMGSINNGPASFLNNVHSADASNIGWALVAGVIFNLANLLLVAAIDMAGLSIAFPVAIGIALVVGVVLSYVQQQRGYLPLLAIGVVCAVVAIILDGKAYGELGGKNKEISRKSIIVCIVSGVLMGLWAPFSTRALTHGNPLGPYSVAVFLTGGALLSCFLWNIYFMKHPLVGEPRFRPRARLNRRRHLGHRHGFQSRRRQLYRRGDLLRDRAIRSDGRRAMGNFSVERICGCEQTRQSLSGDDVRILFSCDSVDRSRQQRLAGSTQPLPAAFESRRPLLQCKPQRRVPLLRATAVLQFGRRWEGLREIAPPVGPRLDFPTD